MEQRRDGEHKPRSSGERQRRCGDVAAAGVDSVLRCNDLKRLLVTALEEALERAPTTNLFAQIRALCEPSSELPTTMGKRLQTRANALPEKGTTICRKFARSLWPSPR